MIVESLVDGRRSNASASSKVSALTEISIFTEGGERVGINTQRYTESQIERVARSAFELARKRAKKVTSVEKAMDVAVFEAIKAAKDGSFSSDPYVGTLENGGVSLAPFHDFEDQVPQELKDQLEQIRQGIIDGSIEVTSPNQPQSAS